MRNKLISSIILMLLGVFGFSAMAGKTNFKLAPGSAAILKTYEFATGSYNFYRALQEGNNEVEYDNQKHLYLFAAPGCESITVTPTDDYVAAAGNFYDVRFSAYMASEYTVVTTGTPAGYTTTVNVAPGSHARIMEKNDKTGEYSLYQALNEGANSVTLKDKADYDPMVVPFYYLCGDEGYQLDAVTDAAGANVSVADNAFLTNAVELTAFTFLTAYNVTTKEKERPTGPVTFILSNGSKAYYTDNYGTNRRDLAPGENWATIPTGGSIRVYPGDGHVFKSFVSKNGASQTVNSKGYVEIFESSLTYNVPYTITTESTGLEDPTMEVYIDDASKVQATLESSGKTVSLVNGWNTITFRRGVKDYLIVETKTTDWIHWPEFYSVKVNGVEQTDHSYCQYLETVEGCRYELLVNFPTGVEYTINLEYSDETDFWTRVLVDGQQVNTATNSFKAAAGSKVELYNANIGDWTVNSIILPDGSKANNITVGSKPVDFTATADGTVKVDAHHAIPFSVTINVMSGVDDIRVVNGDYARGTDVSGLRLGENIITISDNHPQLLISKKDTSMGYAPLHRVTFRANADAEEIDAPMNANYKYYTAAGLGEGAVVNIWATDTDETADKCTVFSDNADGAVRLVSADGREIALNQGPQNVTFLPEENGTDGFAVMVSGASDSFAMFSGEEKLEGNNITLENGGYYLIYTLHKVDGPVTVKFVAEGEEAGFAEIARDGDPVDGTNRDYQTTLMPGLSTFSFTKLDNANVEYVVEGAETQEQDRVVTFTPWNNVAVTARVAEHDGITAIEAANDTEAEYFDLQGRRVVAPVAGLYIRVADGTATKVMVK